MSANRLFTDSCARAVKNERLQKVLATATATFKAKREKAMATLADPDARRALAARVKDNALARLPELLETLERNVVANGGHVHWARDGRHANEIIAAIARDNEVKTVVKGKSMTTEETGLNEVLQEQGARVFETDLGEYIIQLAGERPSHIIAPAVHKNRQDVADLFTEHLGVERTEEPEQLTLIARKALRDEFLRADMGITGANMAMAETGSVILVENEGNIRFSTTTPRIHVAVMGIEKVLPGPTEAGIVLSLLARNGTGLKMSVYTSVFSGPRRADEADGAEEFHLVLLDNGRSRLVADATLRQSLRCLRCGACLNVCPVYGAVGGHAYGTTYPGPIGQCISPSLSSESASPDLPFACTGCGACKEGCPVQIDLPGILQHLRNLAASGQATDPSLRGGPPLSARAAAMFAWTASTPPAWSAACAAARLVGPSRAAKVPVLGKKLARWALKRHLPSLGTPFSRRWPALQRRLKEQAPKEHAND